MAITKEQAIDILDKFDFFQGQRAGRELWNDKPYDVQEEDVKTFSRDVAQLKAYIADVVPKSEYDVVVSALDNSTQEFLKLHDDYQEKKSEVEELIRENESLAKTVNEASELIRKLRSKVKKSKSDVAKDIFEQIESIISPMLGLEDDKEYVAILTTEFAELKKKYTGEKECPNCRYFVGCECFDGKTCDEYEEKKE